MLDALKDFLRSVGTGEQDRRDTAVDDIKVASAALLYHVIDSDGVVTESESLRFREVLAEEFGLGEAETGRVAAAGKEADSEAVDLYHFTTVLKDRLGEADRIRFVELLWEVTYADGTVHELEDNLIWRVSDLLGVSTRDRMLAKREAAARSGITD